MFNFFRKRTKESPRAGPTAVTVADGLRDIAVPGYVPLYECPEVRMCVDAYADMISSMTLHLMRNTPAGDERVVNELSRKIDIDPNRLMNRKSFIYWIVNTMLTTGRGNCVVYPSYKDGLLDELVPLNPELVNFEPDENDGYKIIYGGETFRPDEVLHFAMNPAPSAPWMGRGLQASLREIVGSIRQTDATKNGILKSPAPSLVVMVDGLTEKFASEEGREELRQKYLESNQSGKPWIVPADLMKIEQVKPLSIADLAIRESLELDRRSVAGLYGVPAYMVGVGEYHEDEQQNFVNARIMGIAQYIQQELTAKLLYSRDLYFKFSARSLYNYKLSELIAAGAEMTDRMAMRRNEWRDWVGLPPDADMDELLALENYVPADRLGDQKKLKGGNEE